MKLFSNLDKYSQNIALIYNEKNISINYAFISNKKTGIRIFNADSDQDRQNLS